MRPQAWRATSRARRRSRVPTATPTPERRRPPARDTRPRGRPATAVAGAAPRRDSATTRPSAAKAAPDRAGISQSQSTEPCTSQYAKSEQRRARDATRYRRAAAQSAPARDQRGNDEDSHERRCRRGPSAGASAARRCVDRAGCRRSCAPAGSRRRSCRRRYRRRGDRAKIDPATRQMSYLPAPPKPLTICGVSRVGDVVVALEAVPPEAQRGRPGRRSGARTGRSPTRRRCSGESSDADPRRARSPAPGARRAGRRGPRRCPTTTRAAALASTAARGVGDGIANLDTAAHGLVDGEQASGGQREDDTERGRARRASAAGRV